MRGAPRKDVCLYICGVRRSIRLYVAVYFPPRHWISRVRLLVITHPPCRQSLFTPFLSPQQYAVDNTTPPSATSC